MSFLTPPPPAFFLPQRSFGPFSAYLTIDEESTDDLEITQHPVHDGADITDHAFKLPATVSINIMFSDTTAPLSDTYTNLLNLQASRVPFNMVTGKRTYSNMLLKSLSCSTDALTEKILAIKADMTEIIIVSVETAKVGVSKVSTTPSTAQKEPGVTRATGDGGTKSLSPTEKYEGSAGMTLLDGAEGTVVP